MSATDLDYEFVRAGGLRFEVARAGDPASPRLALLLHGFPEHAISWRHQLPFLAERGYRVWAPNQRGYGNSARPTGVEAYRIEHLVEDVAQLIDASGAQEVMLAGHDWGAMVAWQFAMRRARPLARLVICNVPHPERFREEIQRNKAQRKRSRYVAFFQIPWLPEFLLTRNQAAAVGQAFVGMAVDKSRFPEDVLAVYKRAAREPGAMTAMLNWYRAAWRARSEASPASPAKIEVPTLMVWGEEDRALGKELALGTERFVSDLTLRFLPGVSHWVQQEAPERVNEIWGAWLDGREVPGEPR